MYVCLQGFCSLTITEYSFNGFRDCLIQLTIKVQANEKESIFIFIS